MQGWRFQLSVFATTIADRLQAGAGDTVDAWFAAWSNPDGPTRDASVERIASTDVRFRDRYSLVQGHEDLLAHLAAVHRFMPGLRITREGAVRHCQGIVPAGLGGARRRRRRTRPRPERLHPRRRRPDSVEVVGLWR